MKNSSLLDEYGIKQDARFQQAGREARSIFIFFLITTAWVFGWAIWGNVVDQSGLPHFLGVPLWMSICMFGGLIGYPAIGIIMALRLKDCSLEPIDPVFEATRH